MKPVVDCSVTLAWLFKDERTPALIAIRDRVARHGAWVPSLWWLEVANALLVAERRQRIDRAGRLARLEVLRALPIDTDDETGNRAWGETGELAAEHRLSIHDATYLELAIRRKVPLATLDKELLSAAARIVVEAMPGPAAPPAGRV